MAWSYDMTRDITPSPGASTTNRLPGMDPGEFEFEEGGVLGGYSGEGAFEEEESPFEAGKPEVVRATVTSNVFGASMDKARFLTEYRDAMDPSGEHAGHYEQDFSRLYDLLFQFQQPSAAQIEEFVRIL